MMKPRFLAGLLALPLVIGTRTFVLAADTGYSPTAPGAPPVPGGFTQVVTTQTINPGMSATIAINVNNQPVNLAIPTGAFSTAVQVVVTVPQLSQVTSALPSQGLAGYSALAGLGIAFDTPSGQPITGVFAKPVAVTVHDSAIRPGDRVVEWNAAGHFSPVSATIEPGVASWSFASDPNFVILAPNATVPGATSPVTGKNFDVSIVGGALLLVSGLWLIRRKPAY